MNRGLVAFALSAAIGGCGPSAYQNAAMDRAASSFRCPRASVGSVYLGGGGVEVSGCGQRQSFTCVRTRAGAVCSPDAPAVGSYVPPAGTAANARDRAEVLALLAPCDLAPGTVVSIVIGAPGDVLRIDATGVAQTCAERLRGHPFASRADAELVEIVVPQPTSTAAEPLASAAPVPSATPSELQARVRAMVAARRETILLCNGGAPTAVVADWTADGVLTIRLPDAHAGSAEDGCIRESATGARIEPAPGVAGSLLHPVQ